MVAWQECDPGFMLLFQASSKHQWSNFCDYIKDSIKAEQETNHDIHVCLKIFFWQISLLSVEAYLLTMLFLLVYFSSVSKICIQLPHL